MILSCRTDRFRANIVDPDQTAPEASSNMVYVYEQPHDKNKMACVPSEDSNQPGHLPSLIRVFTVHMKIASVLTYPLSAPRRLIRLG